MTEEQIKEALSRQFVGTVASREGFKAVSPNPDNGVDLQVSRAVYQQRPQGRRLVDDTSVLCLQLKSTCEKQTRRDGDGFKYDLDVTAYNDLVENWQAESYNKLLLVLLVLPDDPAEWMALDNDGLTLRRAAYWYAPEPGAIISTNASTQVIRIPDANILVPDFFSQKFGEYYV
jgi:hypothetical protein